MIGFAGFCLQGCIIEAAFAASGWRASEPDGAYGFWLTVIAAALTSFYSWRLTFMTFHGKPRASVDVMNHAHESPLVMTVPLFILPSAQCLPGWSSTEFFYGEAAMKNSGAGAFTAFADNHILHDMHDVPTWVKLVARSS
jgi:NADH-quinone oxidoreductase subunit L